MRECRKIGGCPTGSAVLTTGGNLKADHVIHAVGPVYRGKGDEAELLASAYRTSLEVAEESGYLDLEIAADLGHQQVEFDHQGRHVVRDEHYFLMRLCAASRAGQGEGQFRPCWLDWETALERLSFEAEREWVRRARTALEERPACE